MKENEKKTNTKEKEDKSSGKMKMKYNRDYYNTKVDVYESDWKNDVKQRKGKLKFYEDKTYKCEFNKEEIFGWGLINFQILSIKEFEVLVKEKELEKFFLLMEN